MFNTPASVKTEQFAEWVKVGRLLITKECVHPFQANAPFLFPNPFLIPSFKVILKINLNPWQTSLGYAPGDLEKLWVSYSGVQEF